MNMLGRSNEISVLQNKRRRGEEEDMDQEKVQSMHDYQEKNDG